MNIIRLSSLQQMCFNKVNSLTCQFFSKHMRINGISLKIFFLLDLQWASGYIKIVITSAPFFSLVFKSLYCILFIFSETKNCFFVGYEHEERLCTYVYFGILCMFHGDFQLLPYVLLFIIPTVWFSLSWPVGYCISIRYM